MQTLGNRSISRRTKVGRALAAWRSDLLADLGGVDSVSQEPALVRIEYQLRSSGVAVLGVGAWVRALR